MASVSSLDSDLRNLRLSKYTPQLSATCVSYISRTLSEPVDDGSDLLDLLRSGVILCRLYNLLSPPVSIKYKASSMPFVQMENISHFLRAISEPPASLPPHDRFLTVDLYERKDPAQVVQCLTAFSRRANELNPRAFPDTIGGVKGGRGGARAVSLEKPRIPEKKKDTVTAWTKKEQEGVTAPAWNVVQYGYMGGASQGSEGISFGGRRQITQTPVITDFEKRRSKEREEREKLRIQKEQEEAERRRQREDEEREFAERERLRTQRQEAENQRLQRERKTARHQCLQEQEALQRRREEEEAEAAHREHIRRERAQEEENARLQSEREAARRKRLEADDRRRRLEAEEEEYRRHESERLALLEVSEREARKDALHIATQEQRKFSVAASHDRAARATPLQLERELGHDPLARERRRVQELEAQLAEAREREKKYTELMTKQSSPPPPVEEQRPLPAAPSKTRIADSRPLPTPPLRNLPPPTARDRDVSWTKGDDQKPISRPNSPVKGPRPPSPVKAPVFRPMSLLEKERERERMRQKEWEKEHQHQY